MTLITRPQDGSFRPRHPSGHAGRFWEQSYCNYCWRQMSHVWRKGRPGSRSEDQGLDQAAGPLVPSVQDQAGLTGPNSCTCVPLLEKAIRSFSDLGPPCLFRTHWHTENKLQPFHWCIMLHDECQPAWGGFVQWLNTCSYFGGACLSWGFSCPSSFSPHPGPAAKTLL